MIGAVVGVSRHRLAMEQQKISFANRNGQGVTMAAFINFPDGFDASLQDPAVIVAHPGGGVKEQTAGLYARKLAEQGFCHYCL